MPTGATDYLSFVRGFTAALTGAAGPPANTGGLDADSYAEGFAAGSEPVEHTLTYRELSIQDSGRFTGALDLEDDPPADPGPWHEPLGQSRTEPPPLEPPDEPAYLSGTLELN
ncbi:hypothetical protein FFT09_07500 [Saccharomonospora piscinae]|uniref:hypothetical protein n=1 Tax=Saccharomonospora piscinae TaxID=687388 RepID=UPI0011058BD5|nr:hypothetical protein [Saccharomonospora piscinae]TLW93251.1 hypothetical protein FFT09_07500 [Saccharomonospora piscinae]